MRWDGAAYQIRRGDIGGGMRGRQVEIEQRLDQTIWMRWKQRRLPLDRCAAEKKSNYRAAWTPPLAEQKPDAAERLRRRQQARVRYNEACQRLPERPCGRPRAKRLVHERKQGKANWSLPLHPIPTAKAQLPKRKFLFG